MNTGASSDSSAAISLPLPSGSRVMLALRHTMAAQGLRYHLATLIGFQVCCEVNHHEQILPLCDQLQPDAIVYDPWMRGNPGLDLIPDLLTCRKGLRIVVMTSDESPFSVQRALQAGAAACTLSHESVETLMTAISGRYTGFCYVGPEAAALLAGEVALGHLTRPLNIAEALSKRELDAYRLLGTALSMKEIAAELKTSVKSVETYLLRIKYKLGVTTTSEIRSGAAKLLEQKRPVTSGPNTLPGCTAFTGFSKQYQTDEINGRLSLFD